MANQILTFDPQGYYHWAQRMSAYLESEGLLWTIDTNSSTPNDQYKLQKGRGKAHSAFYTSLSKTAPRSVNDFSDPQAQNFQAAWEKLRKTYHHLNATLAIQCHRSLNNFTWHDSNDLTTYFKRFNQLLFDCAHANLTIDNA